MTKTFENRVDCEMGIDGFVGPCGDDVGDGEADDDFGYETGGFV